MTTSYPALLSAYTDYLDTLGYARSTVYDYTNFVGHFLSYLSAQGCVEISRLRDQDVLHYYRYLETQRGVRTGRRFSGTHLNRNFIALGKLLHYLHILGVADVPLPSSYRVDPESINPIQVLTVSEISELYDGIKYTFSYHFSADKRELRHKTLELVLHLCYGCGLRKSEALDLRLEDIRYDQSILHVRQGKNYKDRYVPVSDKLLRFFECYCYDYRSQIKSNRDGFVYPFGATAIGQVVPLILAKSSNTVLTSKSPSLHTLRHSIATHLLQNGMSIEHISSFLGHSSLTSTQLYTHLTMSGDNL